MEFGGEDGGVEIWGNEGVGPDKMVFDRVEKKCLITTEQKRRLLKVFKNYLKRDEYYKSEVFNLYFDTENNDLIQRSIERPMFKKKLRARSYAGYDKVFLEIKTKIREPEKNVGHKRRVRLTRREYEKFARGDASVLELIEKEKVRERKRLSKGGVKAGGDGGGSGKNSGRKSEGGRDGVRKDCLGFDNISEEFDRDRQVAKEVDYLVSQFELKPKYLVTYFRESYVNDKGLRITFDEKLRYRTEGLKFRKSRKDKNYFSEGEPDVLMEIKVEGAWPMWLARLLSEERIFAKRFSKIGKVYEKIKKEEQKKTSGKRKNAVK